MLVVEAALCIDEKRFPAALQALDRALVLDRRPERHGRFFLSKAAVLGELGRELQALEALERAESCLDLDKPTLWLRLRLDQLYFLCYAQRFEEAEALLAQARELAAVVGKPADRLEARLAVRACLRRARKAGGSLEPPQKGVRRAPGSRPRVRSRQRRSRCRGRAHGSGQSRFCPRDGPGAGVLDAAREADGCLAVDAQVVPQAGGIRPETGKGEAAGWRIPQDRHPLDPPLHDPRVERLAEDSGRGQGVPIDNVEPAMAEP